MPQKLFTPGPTPIPEAVMKRMSEPIIHHRSDDAKAVFRAVHSDLQSVFMTDQPVLILTCSGTGALEASMTTICCQGDKALVMNNGKFAGRWVDMLKRFGVSAIGIDIPLGEPVTVEHLAPALTQHPDVKTVWIVHSETSTGVYSDVRALSAYIHANSNALVCVDGISSVCAHEMRMDDWGIDVLCTGSQKGLMLPPGLAFAALSARAWKASESSNIPNYYFDLRRALTAHAVDNTPWTPAISLVRGLEVSLQIILREGLEHVWNRHQDNAETLRARLRSSGYELFSSSPSYAVTSVYIPASQPDVVRLMRERHGIRITGGQDKLQSKIFRVGHLGMYTIEDINYVADALHSVLHEG